MLNLIKKRELFFSNAPNTLEKISTIANGLVSGFDKAFICDDKLYSRLNKIGKNLVSIVSQNI